MIREETVFGPIFSRRLGSSLGINLLPEKGKICNFDCIYCECGWNRDGRNDTVLPTAEKVRTDLERMLKKLAAEGTPVDSITFSGDGEPTLNPEFPRIIDDTLRLRDQYYPRAKVSVLSNATRVHLPEVFNALRKVDNPIMKIDAPTNELVAKINMPAPGYDLQRVIEALKRFEGNFVLQTCMLRTENGERRVESGERRVESGERRVESGRWKAWIAAACVAAVVLPLALHGAADDDGIRTVKVDGEQVLFACNTGCSPDGAIETLKTYLR